MVGWFDCLIVGFTIYEPNHQTIKPSSNFLSIEFVTDVSPIIHPIEGDIVEDLF